jgi:multidrug efflux pump subunit AcrB
VAGSLGGGPGGTDQLFAGPVRQFLFGYTINRVTLFALILSLGLVVDDPITNVDNIQRHMFTGKARPIDSVLFAVNEVLPPVIMSTIAIIISFTPLFFITGMMGPYMGPMASNVPMTVIFSTLCALTIVPWMTYLLLKNHPGHGTGGGER